MPRRPAMLDDVLPPGTESDATWDPETRRLDWGLAADDPLYARLAAERDRFDDIAGWRGEQLEREPPGPWPASPWLVPGEVRSLLDRHPELARVDGLTILDIGGTAPVSWRFLAGGARAVHHVDVSPRSQHVALERCQLHGVDIGRLWLHTAPAERLPFRDESFDLVFSRNSVHHTARPAVFDAVARVLKPDGRFLVFEPLLNRALRVAMLASRRLRGVDRGTDDPLWRRDLHDLNARFERVDVGRYGVGATPLIWALSRFRPLHPALRRVREVEETRHTPRLARAVGVHGWVLASRPRLSALRTRR